jgi:hypothetical protein
VGKVKRFAAWGKRLDARLLGPGGWTPHGVSAAQYRFGFFGLARQVCPLWLRLIPWIAFALIAVTAGLGDAIAFPTLVVSVAAAMWATFRMDRAVRIAARAGTLEGIWGSGKDAPTDV